MEARRRRGAAFTFDSSSYADFVRSLRVSPPLPSIPFPTFSHSTKDPTPSKFSITPLHRVVIIEGLYSLLDISPWKEAAELMDAKVWIECPRDVTRERLVSSALYT